MFLHIAGLLLKPAGLQRGHENAGLELAGMIGGVNELGLGVSGAFRGSGEAEREVKCLLQTHTRAAMSHCCATT